MTRSGKRLFFAVRISVAAILLLASALKAHQLATQPAIESSLLTSRWFLASVVEGELLLGLSLAFGIWLQYTWWVTAACFALFGAVALGRALSGQLSCGCFGHVEVNPWWTFVLDLACVASLLLTFRLRLASLSARASGWRLVGFLASFLLVSAPTGLAVTGLDTDRIDLNGQIIGDTGIIVLEPNKWVGRRFPLFRYVDIARELSEGEWTVIFYHHDCPSCQQAIPYYVHLARQTSDQVTSPRVAFIEIPPFGIATGLPADSDAQVGRLLEQREWFIESPTEVTLREGFVTGHSNSEAVNSKVTGKDI